jgi:hypothetical protein
MSDEHNFGSYIESSLRDSLNILLDGTAVYLAGVAAEISVDLTEATLAGRPDLADQLMVLVANKRIEVSKEASKALRAIILTSIRVAVAALTRT